MSDHLRSEDEDRRRLEPRESRRVPILRVLATAAIAGCLAVPASLEASRLERRAVAVQHVLERAGTEGVFVRREGSASEVFEWIRSFERQAPAGRGGLRLEVVAIDEGGPRLIAEVLDDAAMRREEGR